MARTRNRSVGKAEHGQIPYIAHEAPSAEETEGSGSEHDSAQSELTLENEPKRRMLDLNVEFWKGLGYYDSHPNHNRIRRKRDPVKPTKKQQDHGKVKEMYRLCTNPSRTKRTMLLQYPNREPHQQYREETRQKPSEIRIKPKCGVVEVDIPMDTGEFFDQEKGVDFGSALRKAQTLQDEKSYGLAGGLGIGTRRGVKNNEDVLFEYPSKDKLLENFDDSINEGYVMNKITLGGRIIPFREGDPIYMISTFQGAMCTWTKLDAIVQLRPQFSHLDALNEQSRSAARQDRNPEDKIKDDRAEDVNMIIKDTADNESIDMYGGMNDTARLLRLMRDEPWQRLQWIDQSDNSSYDVYDNALVYQQTEDKTKLVSEMSNEQFLDAISCPRIDPVTQGNRVLQSLGAANEVSDNENASADERAVGEDGAEDDVSESDISDGGHIYETVPKGASQPNGKIEQDIEKICRMICTAPSHTSAKLEARFRKLKVKPRFAFLDPGHRYHKYYKWRLERNKAGDGIGPEYDYGVGQEQGQEMMQVA